MSDIGDFILTTGRTLSQMALYSPDHPSVKGAVQQSHLLLQRVLSSQTELVISSSEGKLLINGKIIDEVAEGSVRPFIALLTKFDLHSLSFLPGISAGEMIPFFKLAGRGEVGKAGENLAAALEADGVSHIQVNQAVYAKVKEDDVIGGRQENAPAPDEEKPFWEQVEGCSLNDILMKLIGRAVKDPKEREKIYSHALGLVQNEIEGAVKKATEEFAREKNRLTNERVRTEEVVGQMSDGVVVVDETGRVLMMNPAAEKIYGVTLGECLGRPLWEKAKEEQMIALAKDLTIPTDRPLVKEVAIHATAEARRVLRASSATVQDVNGRVVGMVSVFSDVTKQKELTRLQNEFMANVTHELRSPLHAMKLALGAMLEGSAGKINNEQDKMLTLMNRNLERLARLIDDLLDFSKIEAGKMEIHPNAMDLDATLREAVASLDEWAKRGGVRLVYEQGEKLPLVYADGDRVLQVIVNLLSNALKFTPRGGRVEVRAKTAGEREKRMVQVEVQDSGCGISPADQKRIFEKFTQLDRSRVNEVRGTGLGLSICKAVVELHKGRLSVQSPPPDGGPGSLFSFTLPAPDGLEMKMAASAQMIRPAKERRAPFWKRIFSGFKIVSLLLSASIISCAHSPRPKWGMVHRVISGSLIELSDGSKVRYLGVESPETGSSYYADALSANRRLVEKKEIQLRYGMQDRDLGGAWLAYVFVEGKMVNKELVRNGLAIVASVSNDEEYLPVLLEAEEGAKESRAGIWRDQNIDPYPVRAQKSTGFPWASLEDLKRGTKSGSKESQNAQ